MEYIFCGVVLAGIGGFFKSFLGALFVPAVSWLTSWLTGKFKMQWTDDNRNLAPGDWKLAKTWLPLAGALIATIVWYVLTLLNVPWAADVAKTIAGAFGAPWWTGPILTGIISSTLSNAVFDSVDSARKARASKK